MMVMIVTRWWSGDDDDDDNNDENELKMNYKDAWRYKLQNGEHGYDDLGPPLRRIETKLGLQVGLA